MQCDKCFILVALSLTVGAPVYAQEVPQGVVLVNAANAQWEKSLVGESMKVVGDQTKPVRTFFLPDLVLGDPPPASPIPIRTTGHIQSSLARGTSDSAQSS